MRTLCYSVRLQSLTGISDKCLKAVAFDGTEAMIPKSQYFGDDFDVRSSDAYWISAWILDRVVLQHSRKKEAWFDTSSRKRLPSVVIDRHVPKRISNQTHEIDGSLIR